MGRDLSWFESEPVATRVGPAVLVIVGYLLYKGTIDQNTATLMVGLVGAIFGVGGIAAARAAVVPLAKLVSTNPPPDADANDPPSGRHAE